MLLEETTIGSLGLLSHCIKLRERKIWHVSSHSAQQVSCVQLAISIRAIGADGSNPLTLLLSHSQQPAAPSTALPQ